MSEIEKSFSRQALFYDEYALVQKKGALWLAKEIEKRNFSTGVGNILEIGCGTGILSSYLLKFFHESNIFLSDISMEMIKICREKIQNNYKSPYFFVQDGQTILKKDKFDFITSSFTLQWFENYIEALKNYIESLKKGGSLFVIFQGPESFHEWKAICRKFDIWFSGNEMPEPMIIKALLQAFLLEKKLSDYEMLRKDFTLYYPSSMDFFKSLKHIGASVQTGDRKMSSKDLYKIVKYWDSKKDIKVTYSTWMIKAFKS